MSLAARNVVHCYGDVVALDGVSLDVQAGKSVALVGESGSGKTTLLRCFNRLVEPLSGAISVGGIDVRERDVVTLRRTIGYVPQDGGLMPHWRVLRNVALVASLLDMPSRDEVATEAMTLVGLPAAQFGSRFPHELSGGQRQRAALARALASRPGVVLMDEPFGALDAITRSDLQAAFDALRRELGFTTLMVTHDIAEAARLADELVVMRAGRIEQRGSLSALIAKPETPYVEMLLDRALAASARLREIE
ncbi:MAG: ATP-binding cassette domain-containing protein [Gemmatimonadales bacterium]|jgi:osmoprotectant transport system ATP-binding protein